MGNKLSCGQKRDYDDAKNLCLQCHRFPRQPGLNFCSEFCLSNSIKDPKYTPTPSDVAGGNLQYFNGHPGANPMATYPSAPVSVVMNPNLHMCLQCNRFPRQLGLDFCSEFCLNKAATHATALKRPSPYPSTGSGDTTSSSSNQRGTNLIVGYPGAQMPGGRPDQSYMGNPSSNLLSPPRHNNLNQADGYSYLPDGYARSPVIDTTVNMCLTCHRFPRQPGLAFCSEICSNQTNEPWSGPIGPPVHPDVAPSHRGDSNKFSGQRDMGPSTSRPSVPAPSARRPDPRNAENTAMSVGRSGAGERMNSNNICLQCNASPQQPELNFCSEQCLKTAPRLLNVPTNHAMYLDAENLFTANWQDEYNAPTLEAVYQVQGARKIRTAYKKYRAEVESSRPFLGRRNKLGHPMLEGNEKILFRGIARSCDIGENGKTDTCDNSDCKLCETLESGFGPYLEKRRKRWTGAKPGAALYSCLDSLKAATYAKNVGEAQGSPVHVLALCRVVAGRPFDTEFEESFNKPPEGYNSVFGIPGYGSAFKTPECAVYNKNAICVTHLLVFSCPENIWKHVAESSGSGSENSWSTVSTL